MLVQAFVSEFAIQTFYKCVLCWFTWLNKTQSNTGFFAPEEHRLTGKFSSVVTNYLIWFAALLNQQTLESSDLPATDGNQNQLAYHFTRIIIHHI